jgi:hypothetical protein
MSFITTRLACLPAMALSTVVLLAACGGDHPTAAAEARAMPLTIAPLIDDDGNVMPTDPTAVPADPGAQTRARMYATAAQADQLEHAMKTRVISIEVGNEPDAAQAVDMAVMFAHGLQAVQNVGNDAPVLVRGADLRRAATVVNRLQEHGYSRVFLVAP